METLIVLAVTALVLFLLLFRRPRYDLSALIGLVALSLFGVLTPAEAFSGFANPALLIIVAMAIFSRAIMKTGIVRFAGNQVFAITKGSESPLVFCVVVTIGILSALIFNVFLVAAAIPVFLSASRKYQTAPSRFLIPLSFGALVGGTITLVGNSTNLGIQATLQSSLLLQKYPQLRTLNFTEYAVPGLILLAVVAIYFASFGRKLLPNFHPEKKLTEQYRVRMFLAETKVEANSNLVGRTLAESGLGARDNVTILRIYRLGEALPAPGPNSRIESGDVLLLQGESEDILRLRTERNLSVHEEKREEDFLLGNSEMRIIEAIVAPGCRHAGRTLREIGFRAQFGLNVLALWRHGEVYPLGLKEMPLRVGDVLLLQGIERDFERLKRDGDFLLTEEVQIQNQSVTISFFVFTVLAAALLLPILGIADFSISLLSGALALVLIRALNPKEAYESIDWASVVLTVGMFGLANAWVKVDLDRKLADSLTESGFLAAHPYLLFAMAFGAAALLAQFTRKSATGILLTPLAVALAFRLGIEPHRLIFPVFIGASCPFLSPFTDQANGLVMGPGSYRVKDYMKAGFPLLVIIGLLVIFVIPNLGVL